MSPFGKSDKVPPDALGLRKATGFLAQRKPGKSEGKSLLFPTDYSLAFPGCKASGLAAFSRRARNHTQSCWAAAFLVPAAGTKYIFGVNEFRYGSPEDEVLWCRCTRAAEALASRFMAWQVNYFQQLPFPYAAFFLAFLLSRIAMTRNRAASTPVPIWP